MGKNLRFLILVTLLLPSIGFSQPVEIQSGYSPLTKLPTYITIDINYNSGPISFNPFMPGRNGVIPVTQFIGSLPNDGSSTLIYPTINDIVNAASVSDPYTDAVVTMPFETYIEGVVLGEVGSPTEA